MTATQMTTAKAANRPSYLTLSDIERETHLKEAQIQRISRIGEVVAWLGGEGGYPQKSPRYPLESLPRWRLLKLYVSTEAIEQGVMDATREAWRMVLFVRLADIAEGLLPRAQAEINEANFSEMSAPSHVSMASHLRKLGEVMALTVQHEGREAERVRSEQERVEKDDERQRVEAWAREAGLLTEAQARECLGLCAKEWQAAVKQGLVPTRTAPFAKRVHIAYYDPDLTIPAPERERLRNETLLTRGEAADYLGISERRFDTLKKQPGVPPADEYVTRDGWVGYLYRVRDVEALRPWISRPRAKGRKS